MAGTFEAWEGGRRNHRFSVGGFLTGALRKEKRSGKVIDAV
jgi:hypothetical protein